jgi:hypothetical protein
MRKYAVTHSSEICRNGICDFDRNDIKIDNKVRAHQIYEARREHRGSKSRIGETVSTIPLNVSVIANFYTRIPSMTRKKKKNIESLNDGK